MDFVRRKLAEREYRKMLRARDKEYREIKNELDTEEKFGSWFHSWEEPIETTKAEYKRYRSACWENRARKLLVELPQHDYQEADGYWERQIEGYIVLTDKGVAHVRAAVREEVKAGSEMFFRWAIVALAFLTFCSAAANVIVALLETD